MFTELFIQEKYHEGKRQGREEGRLEGRKEGREEGRLKTILSLYQKGIISLEIAAAEVRLTPEEFLEMEASVNSRE